MNNSGFEKAQFDNQEGELIPVEIASSGRYSFYKVRLNGMLHLVKKVAAGYEDDLLTLESLRKEFSIAYPLNHPAITRYCRFEDSAIYEEFIDGMTLRQMIDSDDERLRQPGFIDRISRSLLEALDYLHSEGVTHLDIKPENLMVTRIGARLKIIDFGCAKSGALDSTPGFTPEYMAPEQSDGNTGIETDIYLAGVTIATLAEAVGASRQWKKFIRKATSDQPADRFHSASEAIEALPLHRRKGERKYIILLSALLVLFPLLFLLLYKNPLTSPALLTTNSTPKRDTLIVVRETAASLPSGDSVNTPSAGQVNMPSVSSAERSPSGSSKYSEVGATSSGLSSVEAKFAKEIKEYIQSYYKRHVHPACQIPGYYPDGTLNHERGDKIRSAIGTALKNCRYYRDQLASKYPEHDDFITRYADEIIGNEQYHLGAIMQRSDKINEPADDPHYRSQNMRDPKDDSTTRSKENETREAQTASTPKEE